MPLLFVYHEIVIAVVAVVILYILYRADLRDNDDWF